jgi:predicted phosphodiesterase
MRLGVVSDVHWTMAPAAEASWHNRFDFAGLPARIESALAVFERARVDAVLACGDVTHAGDEASVRAALERLSARLERPLLVVAGNHDCLERDDQLERCVPDGSEMLTADGVELDGVPLAGVAIETDTETGTFRWTGTGEFPGDERVSLVASHFPVLSRAERLAERGWAYPGNLTNRNALHERLLGAGPMIVISGHIHARDAYARDNLLQLSAGALVEAPYELAVIDLRVTGADIRVRRRVRPLGPSAGERDPVLAPADETWTFGEGGWRPVPAAADSRP